MTDLEKVKILIGSVANDDDDLLTLLLEQSQKIVNSLSFTPQSYDDVVINAVIYAYNLRGAEGSKSKSSGGGISTSWYYDSLRTYIKNNMPNQYVVL